MSGGSMNKRMAKKFYRIICAALGRAEHKGGCEFYVSRCEDFVSFAITLLPLRIPIGLIFQLGRLTQKTRDGMADAIAKKICEALPADSFDWRPNEIIPEDCV